MTLGHEKLDVYLLSIGYVAWVYEKAETPIGVHRPARDQRLRASQSIPLNIAEGNGNTADADRRRSQALLLGAVQVTLFHQLTYELDIQERGLRIRRHS